jgi:hypothetical protein
MTTSGVRKATPRVGVTDPRCGAGIPLSDEQGAEAGRQDAREPNGVGQGQATAEHEEDPLGHREGLMGRAQARGVARVEKVVRELLRRLLVLGGNWHGMITS